MAAARHEDLRNIARGRASRARVTPARESIKSIIAQHVLKIVL